MTRILQAHESVARKSRPSSGARNHRRTNPAEERLPMPTRADIARGKEIKGALGCSTAQQARGTHGRSRALQGGPERAAPPLSSLLLVYQEVWRLIILR